MHCLGGFIPPPAHSPALALEGRGRKHAPVTAIQQVPGDLVPQAILRACPQRILFLTRPLLRRHSGPWALTGHVLTLRDPLDTSGSQRQDLGPGSSGSSRTRVGFGQRWGHNHPRRYR